MGIDVTAEYQEEQHPPGGRKEGSLPGAASRRGRRAMTVPPPGKQMRTIFLITVRRVLSSDLVQSRDYPHVPTADLGACQCAEVLQGPYVGSPLATA